MSLSSFRLHFFLGSRLHINLFKLFLLCLVKKESRVSESALISHSSTLGKDLNLYYLISYEVLL